MKTAQRGFLPLWLIIFVLAAAVVAGGVVYVDNKTSVPSPLEIPEHALMPHATPPPTAVAAPTATPSSGPTAPTPTPTPTPAPTIIPGAGPADWQTYQNYAWQFQVKIPPNWTAEQVGYGLVISGDGAAIRIDTDGVGPDGPGTLSTSTRTVAGQQVEVADGTFFSLKRDNADIQYYWFRINNWTDTVDKILSTFKSW